MGPRSPSYRSTGASVLPPPDDDLSMSGGVQILRRGRSAVINLAVENDGENGSADMYANHQVHTADQ